MKKIDGYALHRMEMYNWGTFNKALWSIEPAGGTALLTGANGSGKSTLVDGLLTLLVPNRKRNYNLASGDRQNDRSEKSYVRGAYGRLSESGVQYLRGEHDYSVLLAQFHSPGAKPEWVTLAQVFYKNAEEKFHVVASQQLSIETHFYAPASMTQLRKGLRQAGAGVFDQFNEYSAHFRKLFHLRSEQALFLFAQTTSMKDVGSLNNFVRNQMLERMDTNAQIQLLRDNFQALTLSYDAIVKAERQQAQLRPIMADGDEYRRIEEQIERARYLETLVPRYFAFQRRALLEDALKTARAQLAEYNESLNRVEQERAAVDARRVDLQVEIKKDDTGQLLEQLREAHKRLRHTLTEQRRSLDQYQALASQVGLAQASDASAFYSNREQADTQVNQAEHDIEQNKEARDDLNRQMAQLQPQRDKLKDDIASLEQRRSQIPKENFDLRAHLVSALGFHDDALPFVGELMRVRDDAAEWEGALERVLRNFSLTLLVLPQYYNELTRYVNRQNLRARLVFREVRTGDNRLPAHVQANRLYHRIDVREETPFTEWIRAELARSFDYVCCETIEEFQHEPRALTRTGQVRDRTRHEKDDRHDVADRKRYVMGWDNRAKLDALRHEAATLDRQYREME
jgi:uncharacterized protein YPO0396